MEVITISQQFFLSIFQPNLSNSSEGDCRYIAPETLHSVFTKAADIFSLGITILELASKLELPKNGYLWHTLRSGMLPDHFLPRKFFHWYQMKIYPSESAMANG